MLSKRWQWFKGKCGLKAVDKNIKHQTTSKSPDDSEVAMRGYGALVTYGGVAWSGHALTMTLFTDANSFTITDAS